jgi:sec-independent protein translocase protein TatA
MGGLSIWHWMIVLVVVLLLFGTGKVSNLMGEFGKGIKSFKQNVTDDDKKVPDASMADLPPIVNPGSISAPLQDSVQQKSTVNQG